MRQESAPRCAWKRSSPIPQRSQLNASAGDEGRAAAVGRRRVAGTERQAVSCAHRRGSGAPGGEGSRRPPGAPDAPRSGRPRGAAERPRAIQSALAHLAHEHKHRPRRSLKRPDLRDVIPQRTPYPLPESTLDAVADLLDLDLEFLLFRHARTREDVVVYRRDDGRIGLLHPPDSPLGDENDIVVPEPSRYAQPIPLAQARDEMDVLNYRFLYFIDAVDGRGKVLYVRHDGD